MYFHYLCDSRLHHWHAILPTTQIVTVTDLHWRSAAVEFRRIAHFRRASQHGVHMAKVTSQLDSNVPVRKNCTREEELHLWGRIWSKSDCGSSRNQQECSSVSRKNRFRRWEEVKGSSVDGKRRFCWYYELVMDPWLSKEQTFSKSS